MSKSIYYKSEAMGVAYKAFAFATMEVITDKKPANEKVAAIDGMIGFLAQFENKLNKDDEGEK